MKKILEGKSWETKFMGYMFSNFNLSEDIKRENRPVFVDRYIHSTVVSHSLFMGKKVIDLSEEIVEYLDLLLPDYVIFLDVENNVAYERMHNRGELTENDKLLESERKLMDKFREGYLTLLGKNYFHEKGYHIIDTTNLTIEEVLNEAASYVRKVTQ